MSSLGRFLILGLLVCLTACQATAVNAPDAGMGAASPSVGAKLAAALAPQATATPTATPPPPTATPSPTSSPTATPTPTPTLPPAVRMAMAQQAARDGDYATAIGLWSDLLKTADATQRAPIGVALARAYIEEGQRREAVALLTRAISETTSAALTAEALGLLGSTYEALGDWRAALTAYERYVQMNPAAASEVRWHMAGAYEALGEYEEAIKALSAMDLAEMAAARRAEVLEKRAELRRKLKDYDGALEDYRRILDFAVIADYRALVLQKQAETQREADRKEQAIALYHRVIREYPKTLAAYQALVALDALEAAQVNDLERGEILFVGGQYAACINALDRYALALQKAGQPITGTLMARAQYTAGLAYERLRQYGDAFARFDIVIEQYPQDSLAPEAWMAKARAARANGGDPSGLYYEFARLYPDHPRAPEALWLGGVALEREGDWKQAATFYRLVRTRYPADRRAAEATFREGLAAYALNDMATAQKVWAERLEGQPPAEERARLLTWLGLAARASGDVQAAYRFWDEAESASPGSYYSYRARDLETGASLRLSRAVTLAPDHDLSEAEWGSIANWARSWAQAPLTATATLTPTTAPASLQAAQEIIARLPGAQALWERATSLLQLGWHAEARATLRQLRAALASDAEGLWALARLTHEAGLDGITISCADQLIALGRSAGVQAPQPLLKLYYPTAYGHLVNAEAERQGVDPLLFMALIRQESLFDPRAVSYAGATGLAQVMPETGKYIAGKLGVAAHRDDWLTRPVVSVRYGVWYLAQTLKDREGDWVAALVAYNAGPGTLSRWTKNEPIGDYDLFYETIPIAQTKEYVARIYQQYRIYQGLYLPRPNEDKEG